MADIFILLPAIEGEPALFAWRASGGWAVGTDCPRSAGRGETAAAFVPATAVTLHTAEVAARKPAEARRMALFALEDDLAEPVENLHAALAPAGETQARAVHVAALTDMRRWTRQLEEAGLPDADLLAPQACLPTDAGAFEGPRASMFRTPGTVFALDSDAPADLVQSLVPEPSGSVHGHRLARILNTAADGEGAADDAAWLSQLADWYRAMPAAAAVSLRQGEFSVRRAMQLDGLTRWRPAAALAAAAAILWLGSVWLETQALERQATALRTQTSTLVAAVAPEANGQFSTAIEMLRQNQRRAASALRPTMGAAALYEALAPVEDAEIRSIRFDGAAGRLTANVIFGSYAEADAIRDRLEAMGLSVRLGEARQTGNRVMGEFAIEAAS